MDASFALFELEDEHTELELGCGAGSLLAGGLRETCALRLQAAHKPPPSRLGVQLLADVKDIIGQLGLGPYVQSQLPVLAARLLELGYDVSVREALGGGSECFKSLRHSFLVVRGRGEYEGMEFIVEPALRAHFTIPHPSPDYEQMLARAPDVFVGGSCRLVPLVQLLCALMADSFERQGLALPPWRKESAMLSKWMPAAGKTRELRPASRSRTGAGPTISSESSQTGYGFAPAASRDSIDFTCGAAAPGSGSGSDSGGSPSSTAAPDSDAAIAGGSPMSVFAMTGAFSPVSRRVGAGGLNAGPYGFGAAIAAAALPTGMHRCHFEPPVLQFGFQLPPAAAAAAGAAAASERPDLGAATGGEGAHQQAQQVQQAQQMLAAEVVRLGRSAATLPHVAVVASKDAAAAACGYESWGALPVVVVANAAAAAAASSGGGAGLMEKADALGSLGGGATTPMSVGGASCCDCGYGSADGWAHSTLGLGLGCITREGPGGGGGVISSLGTGVMIDCCGDDDSEVRVEVLGVLVECGGEGGGWHRSTATGMLPAPCAGEGGRRSLDQAKTVLLGAPCTAAAAAAAASFGVCGGGGDNASGAPPPASARRRQPRRQASEREAMPGGGLAAMMAAAAAGAAAGPAACAATATGVVERRPPVHPAAPAIHLVRRGARQHQQHQQAATAGSRSCCGNEDPVPAPVPPPLQQQQPQAAQLPQAAQQQPLSARPQSQPQPQPHCHSQTEHPLQHQLVAFQRQHCSAAARGAAGKLAVHPIAAAATAATAAAAIASAAAGMRALHTVPPPQASGAFGTAAAKSWLPWKLPAQYEGALDLQQLACPVAAAAEAASQYDSRVPPPQLMPW